MTTAPRRDDAGSVAGEVGKTESSKQADSSTPTTARRTTLAFFDRITAVCPHSSVPTSDVITVIVDERHSLGKQFTEKPDGSYDKFSNVTVAKGIACQFDVPTHTHLAALLRIVGASPNACISNSGWTPCAIGEPFVMLSTTKIENVGFASDSVGMLDGLPAFARITEHARPSTWQLLDRDEDGHTPQWARDLDFDQWRAALDKVLPGFAAVELLRCESSSSRVVLPDGSPVSSGNAHVWVRIADPQDVNRTRTAINARAIELGLAWTKPRLSRTTGSVVGRGIATIVDSSVWTIGRPVFAGKPVVSDNMTIRDVVCTHVPGTESSLDTSLAVVSVLPTCRAARKLGVALKMHESGDGFKSVVSNLLLTTVIEAADGTSKTVAELLASDSGKVRCQAPFRDSSSFAAFYSVDHSGAPFVWDSGTTTKHVLSNSYVQKTPDVVRENLVREVEWRLGKLIGDANADLVFDDDALRTAWDSSFFVPGKSKFGLINRENKYIELHFVDYLDTFRRTFGRIFHSDLLTAAVAEIAVKKGLKPNEQTALMKTALSLEHDPLIDNLKLYRQITSLAPRVDLFAQRGTITVADDVATIRLTHRSFVAPRPVAPAQYADVVADYLQHFPEFSDFLQLILHARFAVDRREAFVWLHSSSSWGKGFLVEIFSQLGLVVDVATKEIEAAMEGKPVGLSLSDMLRPWVTFTDEFKHASSELKQLNCKMTLSPKNQLRCTVPLYTKLFASAENVRSLVGDGVEEQFDRRFAYLAPATSIAKLEDRPLFRALGNGAYLAAMVSFVADALNDGVKKLKAEGQAESEKIAGNFVRRYQAEHRLSAAFGSIDASIASIADEIRHALIAYGRWKPLDGLYAAKPDAVLGMGAPLEQILLRKADIGFAAVTDRGYLRRRVLILRDPTMFVGRYLSASDDRSAVAKMRYKVDDIVRQIGASGSRVRLYANSLGQEAAAGRPGDYRPSGTMIFLDSAD